MELENKITHPLFKDFTQIELDYVFKTATTSTFEKDEILIHEGETGHKIYVLTNGEVSVTKNSEIPGEIIYLATLKEGSVFGEISVITNMPRSATVTTLQKTTVLIIDTITIKKDENAKSIYEKLLKNLTVELSKKLIYVDNKFVKFDPEEQDEIEALDDKSIYAPNSIAVLFGWKWIDIMHEVPFLAAHGYDAIKISPPQEFVMRQGDPWWTIYQPVTYQPSSFYGTKEEFIKMIDFCHGYNIKVYADLILNHMAHYVDSEPEHIGTNGTKFEKYSYGPLNDENDRYEYDDFYHFDPEGNKQISMEDYSKIENIWHLEHYDLVNLPKLNLDNPHVVYVLRKYVKHLLSLGIDGFRIDAAKHLKIKAAEKILVGLKTHDGLKPFSYQEYYTGAPMGIDVYNFMKKYFHLGYVTAFKYGEFISDALTNKSGDLQNLVEHSFGGSWIHYPENRTVVVIDNHDTERMMPNILNYKSSEHNSYVLAYVFMLTWPFGIPKVMSSFRFEGHDDPIPKTNVWQDGRNTAFDKDSPWVAQHRWNAIANMVLFRKLTKDAPGISRVWANGNQVAFARTKQEHKKYVITIGYVVINATAETLTRKFETGLPKGKYFNLISSQLVGEQMQGPTIDVEDYGVTTITVKPFDAVVIVLDFCD